MKKRLILATIVTMLLVLALGIAHAATGTQTLTRSYVDKVGARLTIYHTASTGGCGKSATCTVTKAATCTSSGSADGFCTHCTGDKANFTVVIKLSTTEHTWGKWESSSNTRHTRVCETCGATAGGSHTLTYTNKGETGHRRYCATCGYDETTPHVMETYVEDSNRITTTSHTKMCEYCNYAYNEAHEMISYNWNEPAYHHTACRNCTYHYEPAHTFTYTTNGASTHTGTCTECSYVLTGQAHTFAAATCMKSETCTQCGENQGRGAGARLGSCTLV